MDEQNNSTKESSNGEDTDGTTNEDGQFMNYENSLFRLRKQKDKKESEQSVLMEEEDIWEKERQNRLRAIKTEKLMEVIRSQRNTISMWQSFPCKGDPFAVVFCYEKDCLKAWMNLKAVSLEDRYQLTLTDYEIKLKTEEDKNCCKKNMQGISHTEVLRSYRVPRQIDYQKAVWHQTGDVLEICVPWCCPLF